MKSPRLAALEKNVLKFRAFQMVLLLQEFETMKRGLIGSIRATDGIAGTRRLPLNCKKPFEAALDILVEDGIISTVEKSHAVEFALLRNRIGHEVHRLVADVTAAGGIVQHPCLHDYWALERLENLHQKIRNGMLPKFINQVSLAPVIFEQAELTFKEELTRLDVKIRGQIAVRLKKASRRSGPAGGR